MEQCRNKGTGETGDPRENPPTSSSIIWHDSHLRESGDNQPRIEPGSPWWKASSLTAQFGSRKMLRTFRLPPRRIGFDSRRGYPDFGMWENVGFHRTITVFPAHAFHPLLHRHLIFHTHRLSRHRRYTPAVLNLSTQPSRPACVPSPEVTTTGPQLSVAPGSRLLVEGAGVKQGKGGGLIRPRASSTIRAPTRGSEELELALPVFDLGLQFTAHCALSTPPRVHFKKVDTRTATEVLVLLTSSLDQVSARELGSIIGYHLRFSRCVRSQRVEETDGKVFLKGVRSENRKLQDRRGSCVPGPKCNRLQLRQRYEENAYREKRRKTRRVRCLYGTKQLAFIHWRSYVQNKYDMVNSNAYGTSAPLQRGRGGNPLYKQFLPPVGFPIRVSMEQCQNDGAGETGDPRENPLTSGIVRHDSHLRKSGVNRPGIEPGSPGGRQSYRSATVAPKIDVFR
ncbi:hypothetical protein PR048_006385 [Dryococelus australis]|uniref:Uncharacterized protein n=1 Tax=Dryococelus australis TaxID=614101 RepID=A0ABQ9IC18_9NEOP|nr:hypothetical protein PR048_006385 [Dryococelus australis]